MSQEEIEQVDKTEKEPLETQLAKQAQEEEVLLDVQCSEGISVSKQYTSGTMRRRRKWRKRQSRKLHQWR